MEKVGLINAGWYFFAPNHIWSFFISMICSDRSIGLV